MKEESLAKIKKIEKEAHDRIVARGKVEFRAEPQLISDILDLARDKRLPVGPMVRQWVQERVDKELNSNTQSQLDVIEHKLDKLLSLRKTKSA